MVRFFTREEGRLTGVMKGMRRRRQQSSVQPFCRGELGISGRSGLFTVTRFEITHRYELEADGLSSGFYTLELISRCLAEGQAEPLIYDRTLALLAALENPRARLAPLLRRYEQDFLAALGYGFDFSADEHGEPLAADRAYVWLPDQGFHAGERGIPGKALMEIAAGQFESASVQRHARHLHQLALQPLLGDKPLVSKSLLRGRHG